MASGHSWVHVFCSWVRPLRVEPDHAALHKLQVEHHGTLNPAGLDHGTLHHAAAAAALDHGTLDRGTLAQATGGPRWSGQAAHVASPYEGNSFGDWIALRTNLRTNLIESASPTKLGLDANAEHIRYQNHTPRKMLRIY